MKKLWTALCAAVMVGMTMLPPRLRRKRIQDGDAVVGGAEPNHGHHQEGA